MNSNLVEQRQFKKSVKSWGFGIIMTSLENCLIDKHQHMNKQSLFRAAFAWKLAVQFVCGKKSMTDHFSNVPSFKFVIINVSC